MENNKSFIENIASISKSQDDVQQERVNQEQVDAITSARREYELIKNGITEYAKNSGYIIINGKKTIIYYHKIKSQYGLFVKESSIELVRTIFGGTKIKDKYTISISSHPDNQWDVYYSEILKLAQGDNIDVIAILYDTLMKKEISIFPTTIKTTENSKYVCAELRLKCVVCLD